MTHFQVVLELLVLLLLIFYSVERSLLIGTIHFIHFEVVSLHIDGVSDNAETRDT